MSNSVWVEGLKPMITFNSDESIDLYNVTKKYKIPVKFPREPL